MVQLADEQEVIKHGGFKEVNHYKENEDMKVYVENRFLENLKENQTLIIDATESSSYGRKTVRLSLIKNN